MIERRALIAPVLPLLAALAAHAPAQAEPPPARAPLILISIDGFRADYFDRGVTPTLAALAADGVRAQALKPAFPTLTFPNHYTLVTGLYPDHHGIVHNTMQDPVLGRISLKDNVAASDERWWAQGEPIWVTAQNQGLRAATMFWPGSEARIHGRRPDYWQPFDADLPFAQRVDTVLAWLELPPDRRPAFVTLYFGQVDHAGHDHGPDSS
jgi:predicted AlkP superfamily pyrophosphatase or phosphodiesterase